MKTPSDIKHIIAEKVSGKISPAHDAFGHHYSFESSGVLVDSVTTILSRMIAKPHLLAWSIKKGIEWLESNDRWTRLKDPQFRAEYMIGAQTAYTEFRDDAGSVGTTAHNACEAYINYWINSGQKHPDIRSLFMPHADTRAIAAARAFEALVAKNPTMIPIASEILVGDERYSAGTLDYLCMIDGNLELWDFKTSNQVDPISYPMQVAAYKHFFMKMTGLKIKKVRIIHLSKDSDKFGVYLVPKTNDAFNAFKHLCVAYKWCVSDVDKLPKDIKRIVI